MDKDTALKNYLRLKFADKDKYDSENLGYLASGLSKAASKIGTLGGREAGSTYEPPKKSTFSLDPKIMDYLAKKPAKKDYGKIFKYEDKLGRTRAGKEFQGKLVTSDDDPIIGYPKPKESKGEGNKKYTSGQYRAAKFYLRARQANDMLDQLSSRGTTGAEFGAGIKSALTPESLEPADRQLLRQAQLQFLMSTLRDESGAAIGVQEAAQKLPEYYPQMGESQASIDQKARVRQQLLETLKGEAAGAQDTIEYLPPIDLNKYSASGEKIDQSPSSQRFRVGGKVYNIPLKDVQEFKKDNPNAEEM